MHEPHRMDPDKVPFKLAVRNIMLRCDGMAGPTDTCMCSFGGPSPETPAIRAGCWFGCWLEPIQRGTSKLVPESSIIEGYYASDTSRNEQSRSNLTITDDAELA